MEPHLSPARWRTYADEASRTGASAELLYRWNSELGSAFLEVIGHVECCVREAVDTALRDWNVVQDGRRFSATVSPSTGWAIPDHAASPLRGMINRKAKEAHGRVCRRRRATNDDVVAQLSFGVWVSLLPRERRSSKNRGRWRLWDEGVSGAFPRCRGGDPIRVAKAMERIRELRNRIAHYENLLAVDPGARLADCLLIAAAIDQTAAQEIAAISRVRSVAQRDPRRQVNRVFTVDSGERIRIRPIEPAADGFLLHCAVRDNLLTDNPCAVLRTVMVTPELRFYTEVDLGRGDFGIVAEVSGIPVGCAWLTFADDEAHGYAHVGSGAPELSVGVVDGWRGEGIGRILLAVLLDEAARRGIVRCSLAVAAGNRRARALFAEFGFRPLQRGELRCDGVGAEAPAAERLMVADVRRGGSSTTSRRQWKQSDHERNRS